MSTIIVDRAMLMEPRLLVPGQQPLGPVKVDWTHPLAKNLVSAIIPSQRFDIADGVPLVFTDIDLVGKPNGLCSVAKTDSGASRIATGVAHEFGFGPISMALGFWYLASPTQYTYGIGFGNGSSYYGISPCHASNYVTLYEGTAANSSNINLYGNVGTTKHNILVTTRSNYSYQAGSLKLYINKILGVVVGSYSNTQFGPLKLTINNIIDSGDATTSSNDYAVNFGFFWSRELSAAEVMELSDNPYQFLVPA